MKGMAINTMMKAAAEVDKIVLETREMSLLHVSLLYYYDERLLTKSCHFYERK